MNITVEKNQGLRLSLGSAAPTPLSKARDAGGYYKIRSYHGGGEFFQHDNAQLILQYLGDFLPRATERPAADGSTEVLYEHRVSGHDVCHATAPLNSGIEIPASEIERLQAAIGKLKAKETDASTDASKRSIIAAFRLPDPRKDPELYRLYGPSNNRRLLVLWGVEKEQGSSLNPQDAILQVPKHVKSGGWKWLLWLLLALLILLLLWLFIFKQNESVNVDYPSPKTYPIIGNSDSNSSLPALANTSDQLRAASGLSDTSPKPSTLTTNSTNSAVSDKQRYEALQSNSTDSASNSNNAMSTANSASFTAKSADVTSTQGKSDSATSAKSNATKDAKATAATSNSSTNKAFQDASSKSADATQQKSAAPVSAPPTDSAKPPAGIAPASAMIKPGSPPSAPDQSYIEIIANRTSSTPSQGLVEVDLQAVLHSPDGSIQPLDKVTSWQVDRKPQNDAAGTAITSPKAPIRLGEGQHQVQVNAVLPNGQSVIGEAEVTANIKRTESTDVKVKPKTPPLLTPH